MRQRQFLIIAYRVTVQQQVEVDGARAELLLADAAKPPLHVEQNMEQCPRIEVRLQFRRGVEIGTLTRRTADWLRLVVGGHRCHANLRVVAQQLQRFIEEPARRSPRLLPRAMYAVAGMVLSGIERGLSGLDP